MTTQKTMTEVSRKEGSAVSKTSKQSWNFKMENVQGVTNQVSGALFQGGERE